MKNTELMLKEWRYLRGQTITKVRESPEEYCVALHFESGNFCIIEPILGLAYGGGVRLRTDLKDWSARFLHALDLITDEEYATRKAANEVLMKEKQK